MEAVDSTVIATSLEAIARDLHQDPLALKLALTSYLVSQAVFVPASAWMADRFGGRNIFGAALAVFVAGSIFCGLADTLTGFVFARVVQGLGGAMMLPVGRVLVIRSVPRSEMIAAFAYLTVPAMVGPIIGPPLGGFITTYLHWRWIFWINVPIGLLGALLAWRFIADVRPDKPGHFDVIGFFLASLGFSSVIFGFTVIGGGFLPSWQTAMLIAFGFACCALYLAHARRTAEPLLDLTLLRIRNFRYAVTGSLLFRVSVGAIPLLLPLLLQVGFGMTAAESGSLTFASACGSLVMKAAAPAALGRFGFKHVLIACSFFASLILVIHGFFTAMTPHWLIFLVILTGGFFRSLQFTALNGLAYADIDNDRMSRATSLVSVFQQFSTAAGVAIGAGVVELTLWFHGSTELKANDFALAFWVVAAVTSSSGLVFLSLPKDAAAHVAKGKKKAPPAPKPAREGAPAE